MDIANFHAPRGVQVFADGMPVGTTDDDGQLAIDLPARPRALALDPRAWRVFRDESHRSDVDASTGEFAFDPDQGAALHLYVEKVW